MPTINALDRRVLGALSGGDKVKALLRAAGFENPVTDAARALGAWPPTVSKNIHGHLSTDHIREGLAELLDLPTDDLNALIEEGEPAPVA